MKARIALGVSALWILVGVLWGSQNALGASLRGEPIPLREGLESAFIQSLPWIPVTLAVIWVTVRYPITRRTWRRNAWVHLAALPVVTFAANVLVVLGFWATSGSFGGVGRLFEQGAFWAVQRLHVAAVLYVTIAAITQGVVYYRDVQARDLHMARLEGQLARARLEALNAQVRPHFLFNALHTIGQLWRSGRSADADAMLDRLGSLFQRVHASTARAEVPLAEELAMVEEYLAIEEARFHDRLRPRVEASDEALRCRVPPLILQPLVENAVRHGISRSSSAGVVDVTALVRDGRLVLTVADDGPGFPDGATGLSDGRSSPGTGTGLRSTRERLEQSYGRDAEIDIDTRPGSGTVIRVEIPIRRAGSEPAGKFRDR